MGHSILCNFFTIRHITRSLAAWISSFSWRYSSEAALVLGAWRDYKVLLHSVTGEVNRSYPHRSLHHRRFKCICCGTVSALHSGLARLSLRSSLWLAGRVCDIGRVCSAPAMSFSRKSVDYQFYLRPPTLGKWEAFKLCLYNSSTGEVFGRTGPGWGKHATLAKVTSRTFKNLRKDLLNNSWMLITESKKISEVCAVWEWSTTYKSRVTRTIPTNVIFHKK